METPYDSLIGVAERTAPEQIAELDPEAQAMFERVCVRLGLQDNGQQTLGRYELRGWIANGGMGEVHRAYDTKLEREVAIKLVLPRPMSNLEKLRERLRREAVVLAKLDHANVVSVYDAGVENGRVFLVMQLVTGVTLRERQARKGCSLHERLRLYIEAGRGLNAAHERGIIHRDFKPDNVFVGEDDHARVGDFGLAYVLGEPEVAEDGESGEQYELPARLTETGEWLGTLDYMAPEQLQRRRPDAHSDQYAFCVSLWEGITGVRPFVGVNAKALLEAMAGEPRGGEWLPLRLRRALRVGLALRPEDRHDSIAELLSALERELGRPKRVLLTVVFVALGVAASAGSLFGWWSYQQMNPECPLADDIAGLSADERWSALRAHTLPGTDARFVGYLQVLEADAREACVTKNLALEQRVRTLHRSLELTLESLPNYGPEQIRDFVEDFEDALASRPTQPLSPDISQFIQETITPLEADPTTGDIRSKATEALAELAHSNVDHAELLLHRGRAHSILGDYELAVADFKQARKYALAAGDQDRRLQANIGAAKTTIMRRTDRVEAGAELLELVGEQIWAFDEPLLGSRRADFMELSATLARHEGRLDEALSLQRRVVLRHFIFASLYELVPALTNLGNIHGDRGEIWAAEFSYRLALRLDPGDPEAAVSLGRLLVSENEHPDEARTLLKRVLESSGHDLRVMAAVSSVELEVYAEEPIALAERRDELVRLLRSDEPRTPTHDHEGQIFVVLAFASLKEFGPDFEDALRELGEPHSDAEQLARAQVEVAVADIASSEPVVAKRFLEQAASRLEQLPPSPERTELLDSIRETTKNNLDKIANP